MCHAASFRTQQGTNWGKGYRVAHCPAKLQQRSQFAGVAVCPSESGTSAACAGRTGRAVSGGAQTFCKRRAESRGGARPLLPACDCAQPHSRQGGAKAGSSATAAGSARARCSLRVRTAYRSCAGSGMRLVRVQGEARECCRVRRAAPKLLLKNSRSKLYFVNSRGTDM